MSKKILLGYVKGPKGDPGQMFADMTDEQRTEFAEQISKEVLAFAGICHVSDVAPTSELGKDGDICVVSG